MDALFSRFWIKCADSLHPIGDKESLRNYQNRVLNLRTEALFVSLSEQRERFVKRVNKLQKLFRPI